jgi:hypothetical protein
MHLYHASLSKDTWRSKEALLVVDTGRQESEILPSRQMISITSTNNQYSWCHKFALRLRGGGSDDAKDTKGDSVSADGKKAKKDEKKQTVSYFKLYRHADSWDLFLVFIGTITAAINGVI